MYVCTCMRVLFSYICVFMCLDVRVRKSVYTCIFYSIFYLLNCVCFKSLTLNS